MNITVVAQRTETDSSTALPDLSNLPVRVDRETAAKLLTKYYFRVSPRSLERWTLVWRFVNGRAHCETAALFAIAESMLAAAPAVMGGRAAPIQQQIA
jgi:hypothetical protein